MSAYLHEIQLSNFKSFAGLRKIGPLNRNYFYAIIGPNGVGKSNLIDSVAFCIGEKLSNLRVKKLQDLVHKSAKSATRDTFVAITIQTEDGEKNIFKRSIIRDSSEYRLNGQVITRDKYHMELRGWSINAAAKNFIIHQNDINSIWMINTKERTMLFEQKSHSIDFKDEYDRLKNKDEELKCKTLELQDEKRQLIAYDRRLISAKLESCKQLGLKNDYDNTLIESTLFNLYVIELQSKQFKDNLKRRNRKLEELEKKIHEAEENLRDEKKQLLGLNNTATEVEKKVTDAQENVNNIKPQYLSTQEEISICEKQLVKVEKSLTSAIKGHESREHQIAEMNESLRELMEAKERFIDQCSQQFDQPMEELAEWDRRYVALEAMVSEQTVNLRDKIIFLERTRKPFLDVIENKKRKLNEIKLSIAKKKMSREDIVKRMDTMKGNIGRNEEEIKNKCDLHRESSENINSSESKREDLEKELEVIKAKLIDCEMSEKQRDRVLEEKNIVQILSGSFTGVHDRIYKLLQPIHGRYRIAFTKVFGPYFSNIVVNTTGTAVECIKYLKDNKIGVASFLPLDDRLQVKKLQEKLRSFGKEEGVPNVALLYDVIDFPPEVERVVLHIARNTLVCETAEVARHVAYNLPSGRQYNCVALDGTYYHKSGMFSGGTVALEEKSRMLNAAAREDIVSRKDEICEALKKIRNNKNGADLEILQVEIDQLREKLKYYEKYSKQMEEESKSLEMELNGMNVDLQEVEEVISDTEVELNALNNKVEAVQNEINKIKDRVFAELCDELGISNIRKYEESLRSFKEMKLKELEYDAQCERIRSLLNYEKMRNTQHDVEKWTVKADNIRRKIDEQRVGSSRLTQAYNKHKDNLNNCRNTLAVATGEITKLRENISNNEESLKKMLAHRATLDKNSFVHEIMDNFRRRHNLLVEAKMHDISLPLLEGEAASLTGFYPILEDCDPSQELLEMYEQEDELKFDYTFLSTKPKSTADENEIVQIKLQYKKKLDDLESEISELEAATVTSQEIKVVAGYLKVVNSRLAETRKVRKEIQSSFEEVKQKRLKAFMDCYENAAANINRIYKEMNGNESAQASLWAENEEEPYLGGIGYVCLPPTKRLGTRELSGGEVAIACLSLIFSIQSKNPSPFLLLDEIDAAFDNKNRDKIVTYINRIKSVQQIITISLNKQFFCRSDSCIGVYKKPRNNSQRESNLILLDLSKYQ